MLDVALGEPVAGLIPLAGLEQVLLDVVGGLHVLVQLRIAALEQGLRIGDSDHGLLGVGLGEAKCRGGDDGEGDQAFHLCVFFRP